MVKPLFEELVVDITEALRYAVKGTNLERIESRIRKALAGIQRIKASNTRMIVDPKKIFTPDLNPCPTQKDVVLLSIEKYFGEDRTIFSVPDLTLKVTLHPGWAHKRSEALISANIGHLEKLGHVIKTGKLLGRNHYKLAPLGRERIKEIEKLLLRWKG